MPILSEKERLLRKIQACSFALVEANLYLDSHPTSTATLPAEMVWHILHDTRQKKRSLLLNTMRNTDH